MLKSVTLICLENEPSPFLYILIEVRREKCEYFFCGGCVDVALAGVYAVLFGDRKFAFLVWILPYRCRSAGAWWWVGRRFL